jgi:hypothetical protein
LSHVTREPPTREIIQAEALAWMAENPAPPGTSVITSLPDVSEVPERGFEGWKAWFGEATPSASSSPRAR